MANAVIGEIPSLNQRDTRVELKILLKEVGHQSGGDFQSSALRLVQVRNSPLENAYHFINFP